METQVPREPRVSKVLLVHRDQLAIVDPRDRVGPLVFPVLLELLATAASQDLPGKLDRQVIRDPRAHQVQVEVQDCLEIVEPKVQLGHKDLLVQPDREDQQVSSLSMQCQ